MTPEALGLWLLGRDPVGAELPESALRRLAAHALDDGDCVGRDLRSAHGRRDPEEIAAALGVRVGWSEDDPWSGPFLRHADYRARRPEIRLFRAAIEAVRELVGGCDAAAIFVAHELYHHVEATRAETPLPRRHAVPRLRLGPFRAAAPILALSEVAAGSCAQALLGLDFHPALLDRMTLERIRQGVPA